METETCNHCERDYRTWDKDALRANVGQSIWLDQICKHCACLLRGYHRWSITDDGRRVCADCFRQRWDLADLVRFSAKLRKSERKMHVSA
jgi:hypothetical protein